MKLLDYIEKHYSGNQAAFAKSQEVAPQQVTKWLNMNCIVVDGVLYSPRRELIKLTKKKGVNLPNTFEGKNSK